MTSRSSTPVDPPLNPKEQRTIPHDAPVSVGLWKLLVAAAVILVGLIAAIELFKDRPVEIEVTDRPAEVNGR